MARSSILELKVLSEVVTDSTTAPAKTEQPRIVRKNVRVMALSIVEFLLSWN